MSERFSEIPALPLRFVFGIALSIVVIAAFWATLARSENAPDPQKLEQGRAVFQNAAGVGCKSCHGLFAEGDVGIGPYIRGKDRTALRGAIKFADAMKFLRDELSAEEIDAVSAYYSWLGRVQLVKTVVQGGKFVPDTLSIYPGTEIQLVVINQESKPITVSGESLGITPFVVNGEAPSDVFWQAPQQPGDFGLSCANCGGQPAPALNIRVSPSAKKFEPPVGMAVGLVPAVPEASPPR